VKRFAQQMKIPIIEVLQNSKYEGIKSSNFLMNLVEIKIDNSKRRISKTLLSIHSSICSKVNHSIPPAR